MMRHRSTLGRDRPSLADSKDYQGADDESGLVDTMISQSNEVFTGYMEEEKAEKFT